MSNLFKNYAIVDGEIAFPVSSLYKNYYLRMCDLAFELDFPTAYNVGKLVMREMIKNDEAYTKTPEKFRSEIDMLLKFDYVQAYEFLKKRKYDGGHRSTKVDTNTSTNVEPENKVGLTLVK